MSIVDPKAVLLLGAGVSAPFGAPLGDALMDMMPKKLAAEITRLRKSPAPAEVIRGAINDAHAFWELPLHAATHVDIFANSFSGDPPGREERSHKLARLHALLTNQTSETIDDFVVENPSFASETKAAIAALMITSLYAPLGVGRPLILRNPAARVVDNGLTAPARKETRNWAHLLINIVRQGIRDGIVSKQNKVQVITFNYDSLLEYVLDAQFANTERSYGAWRDYIDIIHMHGELGALIPEIATPASTAFEWAQGVYVVNEIGLSEQVAAQRSRARTAIILAEKIYSAGFAFAQPNVRMLGLYNHGAGGPPHRRVITFCNYDGNAGVAAAAKRLQTQTPMTTVEEVAGNLDRPLSVENWFKGGHAGDLPG